MRVFYVVDAVAYYLLHRQQGRSERERPSKGILLQSWGGGGGGVTGLVR